MKKVLLFMSALLMLLTLSLPVFAGEEGALIGEVPMIDKGIVVIDGEMDDIYSQALTVNINVPHPQFGGTDTSGVAYMLWTEGAWYVYIEVKDAEVLEATENQMTAPWFTDSVEMMFDFGNMHTDLVKQYRVDYIGFPCYYEEGGAVEAYGVDAASKYYDEYAARKNSDGYSIEMMIDLDKFALTEGDSIGLQLQINDIGNDDITTYAGVYYMESSLQPTSWDVEKYDYVTLGAKLVVETEAPATQAPAADIPAAAEPTAPVTPAAPATADMSILTAVAILALSAGAVIASKKNK